MSLVGIVGHGTAWGRGREAPARARVRRQVFLHVGRSRRGAAVCLAALHWRSLCVSVCVFEFLWLWLWVGFAGPGAYDAPAGDRGPQPSLSSRHELLGQASATPGVVHGRVCVGHGGQWWHFAGRCGPVARQQCGIWWGCLWWFFWGWQGGGGAALRPWCVRRTCGGARASAQPRLTADLT